MYEHKETETTQPLTAVHLRALVLALGEKATPAWWKTGFMSQTGLRFLERLYPRTPVRAAVHAGSRAACEAHDKAVGRVGAYHLFRLPESLETGIHFSSPFGDEGFVRRFRLCIEEPDALLEMLSTFRRGRTPKLMDAGPKRVGVASEAPTLEGLARTASVYHNAFIQNTPTFPYFAEAPPHGPGG